MNVSPYRCSSDSQTRGLRAKCFCYHRHRFPSSFMFVMGCCEATNPELIGVVSDSAHDLKWDRRTALKGLVGMAGVIAVSAGSPHANAAAAKLRLAFCGQLLCVVPYEVTRARGHFAEQGFDIELVYTRGGNAAMQALVGGAVDYAGTSFDVALQAFANGAPIRRFASTGRLPFPCRERGTARRPR